MPQHRGKSKDALDYRDRGRITFNTAFDLNQYIADRTSVPDAVAYRLDVPAFLSTLSDKNRSIALDLAQGMTTKEVAQRHCLTPGAISQFRAKFKVWYNAFQGER
jgi:hypothetical protein